MQDTAGKKTLIALLPGDSLAQTLGFSSPIVLVSLLKQHIHYICYYVRYISSVLNLSNIKCICVYSLAISSDPYVTFSLIECEFYHTQTISYVKGS